MVCITMNNAQKNSFVRQQITDTLIEMLKEKSIQEISVSDLTDRAGVGRVSFYRNFSDKEDVLRQESARLLQQWGILFESGQGNAEYSRVFLSLFDYLRQNREFYTVLCGAGLSGILMDTVVATARLNPDMPNLEAYLASKTAGITVYSENDIDGLDLQKIGVPGSGTIVPKIYPPELPEPGQIISTGSVKTDVCRLVEVLSEKGTL